MGESMQCSVIDRRADDFAKRRATKRRVVVDVAGGGTACTDELVSELVKVEEVRSGCGSFRHLGQNVGHKRPHRAHGLDCSCCVAGNHEGVIGM